MSTTAPPGLTGLIVDNEVEVSWISSARPAAVTVTRGRVVAVSTETVHLARKDWPNKIINLERIAVVNVLCAGRVAQRTREQAAHLLSQAAELLVSGDMAGAASALARAESMVPALADVA